MNPNLTRPTSPHLTIYKKQISSVLSIFHRISGMALFFAISLFVWWFIVLIFSNFSECLLSIFEFKITKIALYLASLALFYHLCTGIRHLFWDIGLGFSIPAINRTGWAAVFSCIIFTLIFWLLIV
jgi:succinate dehydrogenase / fumarate reductase cytochrome b subunit